MTPRVHKIEGVTCNAEGLSAIFFPSRILDEWFVTDGEYEGTNVVVVVVFSVMAAFQSDGQAVVGMIARAANDNAACREEAVFRQRRGFWQSGGVAIFVAETKESEAGDVFENKA